MPIIRTSCSRHRYDRQLACEECTAAALNMRRRRLERLERLKRECEERDRREKERAEKRAYREFLQSLRTRIGRERVRYTKDSDGWPRCPKHDERTRRRSNGKHHCASCSREQKRKYKARRKERELQKKHDQALGALYSIRSSLRTLELYGR